MELKYTHIHESLETATMLLKGIIGKDVDGSQFADEIKYLESLGIKDLEIRINSGGGSVVDGYNIVDALLNTTMNTTTYIGGLAASMAGVIAMCGKTIKISNFGILMIHSAGGSGNEDVISKFNNSLIAIFASRTGIDKSYLQKLMNTETFFTPEEAKAAGFVDEIVETKRIITEDVRNTSLEELVNIYNKINIEDMENNEVESTETTNEEVVAVEETVAEVTEEITENAEETAVTEDAITEEIENIEESAEESIEDIKLKLAELSKVNEDLTKQLAEQTAISNELIEKENTRLKSEKEAKESAVINAALASGKITNEVKDTWMNFISIDFDGAKKALDNIVVNKTSPDIMNVVSSAVENKAIPMEKTHRQLEKENPAELLRIKNETPEIYKELYKAEYGNYPTL